MKKFSIGFLVCMALSGAALAGDGGSADTIAKLNEEIAIMAARIRLLEAELQMAQKRAELAKLNGVTDANKDVRPSLRSIEGVNGTMYATFAYTDGGMVTVEKGEKLPGGWVVESIQLRGVTIIKGKEREQLNLRSTQLQAATIAAPAR